MFLGGLSYPDAPAIGVAGTELLFNRVEFVCAAIGTDVAQATSAPTKKQFKAFWSGTSSPRFISQAKTDIQDNTAWV